MASYRNIEISEPPYERDHLRLLTFSSPALRSRGDVTLFVPPDLSSSAPPLVILLHGVYGSHWSWAWRGGAHSTALRLIEQGSIKPMVLAMPSDGLRGDGSGYLRHPDTDCEKWIVDDVPGCVTEVVPQLGAGSPIFIAGLSMGGYGSLRLGAKYPRRFRGISAHSAVTTTDRLAQIIGELPAGGDAEGAMDLEILHWVRENRTILPALRLDCGADDPLIEDNRRLHGDLTRLDVPHVFAEFEGEHSWTYWREHLAETLLFFDSLT